MGKKKLPWKIIAPFVAVLLIVAGACALKMGNPPAPAQEEEQDQEQAQADDQQQPPEDHESATKLTDSQKKALEAYGEAETAVIEVLRANVWASGTSSATLRFGENNMTETKEDATDIQRVFILTACKFETVSGGDAGYTTKYTCSVDTGEDKFHILTLSQIHPASGAEQPWAIDSDCFSYSTSYSRIDAATEFAVQGLNESIMELLGGEENASRMQVVLKDYCSQNYPAASTATWDEKAAIDYKSNSIVLSFQLNNQSRATVKVLNALGSSSFEVGR